MQRRTAQHLGSPTPARPFLKWPGGKGQLLDQLGPLFPPMLTQGRVTTYVEPFVGAGAVFFHVTQQYRIEHAYLCDINADLCLTYRVIQRHARQLIEVLAELSQRYLAHSDGRREDLYYEVRAQYNAASGSAAAVQRAAQLIFLNHTCYNGLYRTNGSGEFNVPFGRYTNPRILDEANLLAVASVLKRATIHHGDFEQCATHVDAHTFVYFDPPYRPVSRTSSFTSYARDGFGDREQQRLARFYARLDAERHPALMLSNSAPADRFFHGLYQDFTISQVRAKRPINSNARRRGTVAELVITNYDVDCRVDQAHP